MLVKAEQKYIRMSPTKLRFVANAVRNMNPDTAVLYLEKVNKFASVPIAKTIKQALANARNNLKITDKLVFHQLAINEGPTFKRGMAASRGQYHPIAKKTAHIRVVLKTIAANNKLEVKKVRSASRKSLGGTKKGEGK